MQACNVKTWRQMLNESSKKKGEVAALMANRRGQGLLFYGLSSKNIWPLKLSKNKSKESVRRETIHKCCANLAKVAWTDIVTFWYFLWFATSYSTSLSLGSPNPTFAQWDNTFFTEALWIFKIMFINSSYYLLYNKHTVS